MAIAIITAWLQSPNRNYAAGNMLYQQYGTNALIKVILNKGDSDYHFNRLIAALEELNLTSTQTLQTPKPVLIPSLESLPVSQTRYSLTDKEWENAPDEIKDLYTETRRLNSRADLLYHNTRHLNNPSDRLELALQQLDDRDQVNKNWAIIKQFHATGQIAEEVKAAALTAVEDMTVPALLKERANLPTYISKDRASLKKMADGQKKNKVLHRLQANEIKLELIKRRLDDVV